MAYAKNDFDENIGESNSLQCGHTSLETLLGTPTVAAFGCVIQIGIEFLLGRKTKNLLFSQEWKNYVMIFRRLYEEQNSLEFLTCKVFFWSYLQKNTFVVIKAQFSWLELAGN